MTTTTLERPATQSVAASRPAPAPIPFGRIVGVELRKMFDTRSGFWLLASIAIASVLATGAVILWAPENELTYETFATAFGFPMSVILPMIAVLSVTSEWSQRSALTTFTLVPHRGRVIAAKAVCTVAIGVVGMALAAAIGAVGNVVGTTIAGVDTTWNVSMLELAHITLASVLGMTVGFTLGALIRNSAGAIVAYFVFALVLPGISSALASSQVWWRDNGPWFDFNYASSAMYDGSMTGEQWAQLGTTTAIWVVVPLVIGLWTMLRSEVK